MIYFNTPSILIYWDNAVGCAVMKWKQDNGGDDFKIGLDKSLELIHMKGSKKWLADLSAVESISKKDQNWLNIIWSPKALQTGIRFMAFIIPEKIFSIIAIA